MKKDQQTFLEHVLMQSGCTHTPYYTTDSLKRFIATLKVNGCTHISMYYCIEQHGDMKIVPILFEFFKVESSHSPGEEYIPLDTEYAKIIIALFLADCGIDFKHELIVY
jgi:hypothetical protein